MIPRLTIAGESVPLVQISIRQDANSGSLSIQLAGYHDIAIGAACVFTVGIDSFTGVVSDASPGPRITTVTASLPVSTASGDWVPDEILTRTESMIRSPLDFLLLPGKQWMGVVITAITHTMGAQSPWFTEARWDG
jgi:hypothetical protein